MMDKLAASRITGGNTAYKRVASDYYPTPPEVTLALLNWLGLWKGTRIWEPACGEGHMVRVIEAEGYSVRATDIQSGTDFLAGMLPADDINFIITNPLFSLADKFIERCALYGRPFALLLKSQYWHAKKRLDLFQRYQPDYILPLTWRPDFLFGERGGGSPLMDVMWCVWLRNSELNTETRYYPLPKPDITKKDDDK